MLNMPWKKAVRRRLLPAALTAAMAVTMVVPAAAADTAADNTNTAASEAAAASASTDAEDAALDFETAGYTWTAGSSYYSITGVTYCTNVTNSEYQTMNIYAPADYFNSDGSINYDAEVNGYTAETAPIILMNNNAGWKSGSAGNVDSDCIEAGYVYVNCGSRSRDAEGTDSNGNTINTGKAPTAVVDLKSAVRDLRLNAEYIPGDTDRIVSIGSSGGGQMSSILGASGNMDEYYSYLYENGAAGIDYDETTGEYTSTIDDDIYASMCYCPIADLDNADMAYAWWYYDSTDQNSSYTDFQVALQEDLAVAFCEYINETGVYDEDGNLLTFDYDEDGNVNPRSGSYYEQILQNISDALNAFIENTEWPYSGSSSSDGLGGDSSSGPSGDSSSGPGGDSSSGPGSDSSSGPSGMTSLFSTSLTVSTYATSYEDFEEYAEANYSDIDDWLVENEDGTWSVTDMAGFIAGTGLTRFKDIPGFDVFNYGEEADAFGDSDEEAVHFSASVAAVLQENYDTYKEMDGFSDCDVDTYIEEATTRTDVQEQVYLMNATQIMRDVADGEQEADIASYWRTRNGTADPHTSFSVAYNLAMAANEAGASGVDYSLVWEMGHGSDEGETTGTFVDWVAEITAESTDDGTTDDETTDDETTDDGTTDDGTTDDGTTDDGTTDDGTTDDGTTDDGTTDDGTTDDGTTDDGTTDDGTTDDGTTDDGTTDDGTTDNGSTDDGSTDDGTTDDGTTDDGSTDDGSTDDGTTDGGTTDEGTTDDGTTDDGTTDDGTSDDTAALQAAAQTVIDLIDAIGTVTLDSKDQIEAARAAYEALSDEAKALVTNLDTLTAAEEAYAALAAGSGTTEGSSTADTSSTLADNTDTTTIKGVTYQILNKKKGTAKVIKIAKNKKKVTIKNSVKIGGKKYKVTVITKNAAKGNKKLKKVTIGKNVTKIAANAFKGDKKLKNVIIKSKKLKAVGKNAFKNTAKEITIKSPKAKKAKYKKLISKKKTGISKNAVYK